MLLYPIVFHILWESYCHNFSTIFLGIGLILLVDFAHAWAEKCLEKIEMEELTGEGDASFWKKLLIGGTLAMYIGSIILTILMYWFSLVVDVL